MKGPISPNVFFFYWPKKEVTGYFKSCRNCHTQSPIIWLNFSLSNCLCWCCVDKISTNYSVGCWLEHYQQNVEVTYWKMQPNGVPGKRKSAVAFSLNLGLCLCLAKAHNENCCVLSLTITWKWKEHHCLAQGSFCSPALVHIAFSSFTRTLFF